MVAFFVLVVALLLVGFSIRLVYISRPAPAERMLDNYAREVGLALIDNIEPALTRRILARERAAMIGSTIALVLSAALMLPLLGPALNQWAGLLLIMATIVGSTVGAMIDSSRSAFAAVPDSPRIARSTTPTVEDYVAPLDRLFARAFLLIAVVAFVGVTAILLLNPGRVADGVSVAPLLWPAAVLLCCALAASLVERVAARALLQRGQPANSYVELAWSDALRSTNLRGLIGIPGILGYLSTFFTVLSLSVALGAGESSAISLGGTLQNIAILGAIAMSVWTVVSRRIRSTTYYLRRLWPDTAAQLPGAAPAKEPV